MVRKIKNKCCVRNCNKEYRLMKEVSSHKFPEDEKLKRKWIENIKNLNMQSGGISENARVCSKHFEDECFLEKQFSFSYKRLKPGSVPTIFPNSNNSETFIVVDEYNNHDSKRSWTREETLLLLECYRKRKNDFDNVKKTKYIYDNILKDLVSSGILKEETTSLMIKNKIHNLLKSYKAASDHNSQTGVEPVEVPFEKELNEIFGDKLIFSNNHSVNLNSAPIKVLQTLATSSTETRLSELAPISSSLSSSSIKWSSLKKSPLQTASSSTMPSSKKKQGTDNNTYLIQKLELKEKELKKQIDKTKITMAEKSSGMDSVMVNEYNSNSRRSWTREETLYLLEYYRKRINEFNHVRKKKYAYENVLEDLVSDGILRQETTPLMLKNKIHNLLKSYKAAKDHNSQIGVEPVEVPFEEELNEIFGDKLIFSNIHCINSSSSPRSTLKTIAAPSTATKLQQPITTSLDRCSSSISSTKSSVQIPYLPSTVSSSVHREKHKMEKKTYLVKKLKLKEKELEIKKQIAEKKMEEAQKRHEEKMLILKKYLESQNNSVKVNKYDRKKWTREETLFLLECYKKRKNELNHVGNKMFAYENIWRDLVSEGILGPETTPIMIKNQIHNLLKSYKAANNHNNSQTDVKPVHLPFENELREIFDDELIISNNYSPNLSSSPSEALEIAETSSTATKLLQPLPILLTLCSSSTSSTSTQSSLQTVSSTSPLSRKKQNINKNTYLIKKIKLKEKAMDMKYEIAEKKKMEKAKRKHEENLLKKYLESQNKAVRNQTKFLNIPLRKNVLRNDQSLNSSSSSCSNLEEIHANDSDIVSDTGSADYHTEAIFIENSHEEFYLNSDELELEDS